MTNESLQSLLSRLNNNDKTSGLIYLRPLNTNVDFAKIWIDEPKPTDSVTNSDGPDNFYLVKNNENIFVAIVFDMKRDLHWFVLPDYRGMGYLTEAMKHSIIPHLFFSREEQRITIKENEIGKDNCKASEKVALILGFTAYKDGEYLLSNKQYTIEDHNLGENTQLSYDRIDELKKQRELKQKELSSLRAKSIHELLDINDINETVIINKEYLNECMFDEVIEDDKKIDILKDDLLMYLLRYGHIKENYFKYISYYHSGQETPIDINFILNVQRNGTHLSYDLGLTHFGYIFTELNSVKFFSKEAILNYSLMHKLLNYREFSDSFKMIDSNEKYSNIAIEIITKQFILNMDEYFDFIDNYIEFYNDSSILEHPSLWISNLWEFIMLHKDFSTEKKDKYFYLIFEINEKNKDLELLKIIDKENLLTQSHLQIIKNNP